MFGGFYKKLERAKKGVACILIIIYILLSFGDGLITDFFPTNTPRAEAAPSTIDSDASTVGTSHIISGSQTVFTDDQTGYKFFVDAPGYCVYRKTTDGGSSWSATTSVDSQVDCLAVSVWYDKWTPGSASSSIHIATIDGSADDIFYNRLDTDSDTLLLGSSPVSAVTNPAQGGSLTAGQNQVSITRSTTGILYASSIDAGDSYVVRCTLSCATATNWTEAGSTTNPYGLTNNYAILAPLPGGDILTVHRDVPSTAEDMGSKVYNAGTDMWDIATTTFDSNAPDNGTYDVGMALTVSSSTGDIYVAYIARNATPGADDQIRTAIYSEGAWTTKKEVVRYTEKGLTSVAIGLDYSNDDVFIAYSARIYATLATSTSVYWRKSTDGMDSWSFESGAINTTLGDISGVDMNLTSNERMYVTWFDDTGNDIFGETLENIYPGIHVTVKEFNQSNSSDSYSQVTLDATAHVNGSSNLMSGSQTVFIDDQTGYKFFRDAPGYCVYVKTSDGGSSWSATTSVDSQLDCHQITVWYDGWTPGSASTSIHILTADASADDLWYNRLDTSSDTRLMGATPVSITTAQGGSLTEAENYISITRGTDGTLYAVSNDGTVGPDSYIVECTVTCSVAGNWSETGANPLDSASDFNILMPLSGGDIMLINRDISTDIVRSKIWDNANWSGTWTGIGGSALDNTTYDVGMAVAISTTTGDLYLAYIANNDGFGSNDEIRTSFYSSGSWATTTTVATSTTVGLTNVAIAVDSTNDDVYVAYSSRATPGTAATANVLWNRSTDNMTTWSYENGPINTSPDDLYGVDLNLASQSRLYVTWYDATDDDIYGATLIDLPTSEMATTGMQIASVYASTSNVYIGGVFAFYNTLDRETLDVTGITISEGGTIDGSLNIADVKLQYEMDSVSPYDCASVSYDGGESPFGSVDANGFSGADGVSSFSGTTVSVSSTTALCVYPSMTILDSASSSSTIDIYIASPSSDVIVTNSTPGPTTEQNIASSTLVYNDNTTLAYYHWRDDDGSEITATSKTGGIENTSLTTMRQGSTTRLRLSISNEGSSSTPAMQYRLEYASNPGTCSAATGWVDVGAADGDFDMSNSVNLTEGADTADILVASGGVSDPNTNFLTPNGGVKDTSSQTGSIVLTPIDYLELEYSIIASTSAVEGNTYCFRVTDQGNALFTYDQYPRANIAADVLVTIATSSQKASTTIPSLNYYVGSAFVIAENVATRTVSSITLTENGSVDGLTEIDNVRVYYDLDTSIPYDCASEAYDGTEPQYGATSTLGFSSANGTSTFNDSVEISTTSTMCLYTGLDIVSAADHGDTLDVIMENPSINLVVSSGSVSPTITRDMNGTTTLVGAIMTQTHYHWRNDNGGDATSTSATNGVQDTAVTYISQNTPMRLRVQVSNEGAVTSASTSLLIEYGAKISTCSAVSSWTDIGETGGAFDMYDSIYIENGTNTLDVVEAIGGVADENSVFKSPNSAMRDTSSRVSTTTLESTEYIEAEFSIRQTVDAGFDIPYCFRLTSGGNELDVYTNYPELTTSPERDFEIQRNTTTILASSTTATIVAGIDYITPVASTSAFIRITNIGITGAGHNTGATAAQNATNTTVYILDPSNIMSSITFVRSGISSTTRVSWEIIEFIGEAGSDNEMIVRSQTSISYGATSLFATGTTATVSDDTDVVVFITGQQNRDTASTNFNSGLSTSDWHYAGDVPVLRREAHGNDANAISYAVVEFTGQNWAVQRVEHTYSAAGTTQTEDITPVNDRGRTFLHTQKRSTTTLTGTDEFGAEVWLSGIGVVSFFLESGSTNPAGQTSVAWVIENTQTTSGAMEVTRSNNSTSGGTAPHTVSVPINKTLTDLTNSSIFTNARSSGTGTVYPQPIGAVTIASTTHYTIWRSNTGSTLTFRTEVVEWPTAGLAVMQNVFQLYVDNNALDPTDPWPEGGVDLGENDVLTGADEPLGEGEHIRIRMTIHALNATLPAGTRAFKLQYGVMNTTCSAISEATWATLGNSASSTVWRGYDAAGTVDGTLLSDLNIVSTSDVAGTLEEENTTDVNTYALPVNEDMEFDWIVQQNGANAETFYCFRMVDADGTPLDSYAPTYPQIRTASFTPRTQNWRWYDDEASETPVVPLAGENVAPIEIANAQAIALRISVKEIKNIARDDVRFKLQFSEYANFAVAENVVASTSCNATSTWCYVYGGGVDNAVLTTGTLSDADSCIASVGDGCGTHNETPDTLTGFRHESNATAEYSFTIRSAGPRVNRVYYFRLYDVVQDIPVPSNTTESYPSLATEGSSLSFSVTGIDSATVLGDITTDIDTTLTSIPFGSVPLNTSLEGAHRLSVDTNGTQGHKILMMLTSDAITSGGATLKYVTGTNAVPTGWNTGCDSNATSCFGYHTGDDTLEGGSARFSAVDTYARFSTTTLEEVSYSSHPVTNEATNIIFRLYVRSLQDAGQYETNVRYISVPMF